MSFNFFMNARLDRALSFGQCLNSWRVTSEHILHGSDHIARSILSSFPYYNTLAIIYAVVKVTKTMRSGCLLVHSLVHHTQ